MIEYVFRHSRIVDGKRTLLRVLSGRYALAKGDKPTTVSLNTPDREIARKRLRAIVLEKQREQEGIIAPKAVRVAATTPLYNLIADYEADLLGRDLDDRHVHDTIARLKRMVAETGWRALSEIRPDAFVSWRATLTCSAKTIKEYQTSASAFLNWLVRVDRLAANPLAKIDKIDARGKQVREPRAFTKDELRRLFAVAGRRLPAYLVLLYTGQRKDEVRSLVWGDLHLDEVQPYVLVRESTTKDKDKRAVPLHRELAGLLREMRPPDATPTTSVFIGRFPTYESLRADLDKAGIPHTDDLGRVCTFIHFERPGRRSVFAMESTSVQRRKFWDIPIPHSRLGRTRTSRHSHCIQRSRSYHGFRARKSAHKGAHKNPENRVIWRHFVSLRVNYTKSRK